MCDMGLDFGIFEPHGGFVGSHAVIILSDQDSILDAVINTIKFFKHESCGQCTPCRNGTEKLISLLSKSNKDVELYEDLMMVMRDSSICGLGQAATNCLNHLFKYFSEELNGTDDKDAIIKTIEFSLNGKIVSASNDETIWQVAKRMDLEIPHLCWKDSPGYRADGNCRACMVEIEGERTLAASCLRKPTPGMKVVTSKRVEKNRELVFELLKSDMPKREESPDPDSHFWNKLEKF